MFLPFCAPSREHAPGKRVEKGSSNESGGKPMNPDQIEGHWKQLKGSVKKQWGKLTDNDLAEIEGDVEMLVGKIQERYGIERAEAERQLRNWEH
jgi:uncharacterized protein YjbJ (UPF0337 family)